MERDTESVTSVSVVMLWVAVTMVMEAVGDSVVWVTVSSYSVLQLSVITVPVNIRLVSTSDNVWYMLEMVERVPVDNSPLMLLYTGKVENLLSSKLVARLSGRLAVGKTDWVGIVKVGTVGEEGNVVDGTATVPASSVDAGVSASDDVTKLDGSVMVSAV